MRKVNILEGALTMLLFVGMVFISIPQIFRLLGKK